MTGLLKRPLDARGVLLALVGLCALGLLLFVGGLAAGAYARHYPWRVMDWNHDGHTTLGEFLGAADVATRPAADSAHRCTEYFALKDGRTLRTECA